MKYLILMRTNVLCLFCMLLIVTSVQAQHTVQGIVKDASGEPVIGASVIVKGTRTGASTNAEGFYKLNNVSINSALVFSFIGYGTKEVVYKGQPQLNVTLTEDAKMLEDVVVIGYGQVRKGDATGSISAVKADASVRGLAPNAQDMLVGKVAGVSITSEGGSPSSGAAIRIRGGSSLSASNDPLIVVDGIFIDNQGLGGVGNILSTINPTDIESFTVLKDASATAIYGSRASNGVILITTKKGTAGKTRIAYDGNVSVSSPKKNIDVLTAGDFRSFIDREYSQLSTYDELKGKLGSSNTSWQDEIFRTTLNNEHNISIYGSAGKKLPYRASAGYTDLQGILETSVMKRTTGSVSLSPSLFDDHLKMTLNGRGMYAYNRFANQASIGAAINMDPTQPVYDPASKFGGYFTWLTGGIPNQVATVNPVSMLTMNRDISDVYNFVGNAQFDYKLHSLPDLHFNLNVGMDYSNSDGFRYIPADAPSDYNYGGYDSDWTQKRRNETLDFYTQYFHNLDALDSKFDIMAGYSWQHYRRSGDNIAYRISRLDEQGNPLLVSTSDYDTEHYIVSFFGRLNYSVKEKYLLTFTLRDDGSSRFSKKNRWALFPSLGLAWRIKDESFLKNSTTISNLKLRLGWGMTGQQDINQGDYPYLGTYQHSIGAEASYLRGYNNGEPVWVSLLRPGAFNPDLKWESTETYNAGIDYGLFNNRLEGAIDVYHRKTKDLINAKTKIAAGTNFSEYVAANIGNLENTGFELSANAHVIDRKNLKWDFAGNIAYNKNELTKLTNSDDPNALRQEGMLVQKVGSPVNSFYVYEQIYDDQAKPIEGLYRDRNGDGLINEQDLHVYKNAAPDFNFGLNSKLTWRSWDFTIAGHGSLGKYNYNAIAANNAAISSTSVFANEFLTNRVTSALSTRFQTGQPQSDYYIQDASFFRIDNIVLGYSFKKLKNLPFGGRVYGTVQNPLVFTKYSELDPEVFGGIDNNVYPRPFTVMLGVNLNF